MRIPRKPIIIQAEIEPDGARVLSDKNMDVLPVGTLIQWGQVGTSEHTHLVKDKHGDQILIEGRNIFLQFGSRLRSSHGSTRLAIEEAKKSWYKDPENEFKIQLLPFGVKKAARQASSIEFMFGLFFFFLAVAESFPALDRPNPIARSVDHWIVLGIWSISVILIVSSVARYHRLLKSTWVVLATNDGVRVQSPNDDRFVPWSKTELLRKRFILYPLLIGNGELAYVLPSSEIRIVFCSRLKLPKPKLFTLAFILMLLFSLMSGPCVLWFYQYLQVPIQGSWIGVSGISLFLCSFLVLHHYLGLKEFREANESLSSDFPIIG